MPPTPEEIAEWRASYLTPREIEVIGLLVEGKTSEAIAERLTISRNTVRTHVGNVFDKLGVHSRLEAAAFAVRHGVVKVDRWS